MPFGHRNSGFELPVASFSGGSSSCCCFSDLNIKLFLRLRQRRNPTSARAITPQGTATPAAIATVRELLVDSLEVAGVGVEVADAAVVEAVAAGDAVAVAAPVDTAHSWCQSELPPPHSAHVPAVVVASPASTPKAQYASNTAMALVACADHIDELHDAEMADVIS